MKNKNLPDLIVGLGLLVLGTGLYLGISSTLEASSFSSLHLLACFFSVFLTAGWLLSQIIFLREQHDFFENAALSFGLNVIVLVLVGVVTLEFSRNAQWALSLLFAIQWLLAMMALVLFFKKPKGEEGGANFSIQKTIPGFIFLGALIFFSVIYDRLGGFFQDGVPTGEELWHLGMMRKLAENPVITFDNFCYRKGGHSAYLYPPYHLAMAMTSRLSGFDVLSVFGKFRTFSGLIALPIFYSLAKNLFKKDWVTWSITFFTTTLCFLQIAGDIPNHYWGQFAPLPLPSDFAGGLLMPVVSLYLIKAIDLTRGRWNVYFILTPLLIAAIATIHVREAFHILLFCVFLILGFLWIGLKEEKKEFITRSLIILGLGGLLGVVYLVRHHSVPSEFTEWELYRRVYGLRVLRSLFKTPFWGIFRPEEISLYLAQVPALFGGWLSPAFFLTPFLIFLRRSRAAVILFSIIFFFLIFFRIPFLQQLVSSASFSEIFMFSTRLVSVWCYLILGFFFFLFFNWLHRKPVRWLAALPFFFFLPRALHFFSLQAGRYPDILILWLLVGSIAGWRFVSKRESNNKPFDRPGVDSPYKGGLVLALVLISLMLGHSGTNLWQRSQNASGQPSVLEGERWYRQSALEKDFPYDMVSFIRRDIPIHSVFAYDFKYIYTLPAAANQHIVSAGYILQEEIPFMEEYLRWKGDASYKMTPSDGWTTRIKKHFSLFDRHIRVTKEERPIFNPKNAPDDIESYARAMNVDYILVHPQDYDRLVSLLGVKPESFKKIYDQNSYAIFQVLRRM